MNNSMYISRKVIEATPMTYGEFLEETETESSGFSPDTPGYLIEHSDIQVEWVEKAAFEDIYMEIGNLDGLEPYQQRLMTERILLVLHYEELKRSFASTTFLAQPFEMRELLQAQERAMARYLEVLNKRVNLFLH